MKYKHRKKIVMGKKGEISYIREELEELTDAHEQNIKSWQIVESADLIISLDKFLKKQLGIPLIFVIILAYIRMGYKPIRNFVLDRCHVNKAKNLNNICPRCGDDLVLDEETEILYCSSCRADRAEEDTLPNDVKTGLNSSNCFYGNE